MKLIKELENTANIQADLKKSDATDAGNGDSSDVTDLEFKTLRNGISKPDEITGAAVKDYLEKAAEINDEVDTIVFGLEDENGDIVKIYVAADQADDFEAKMSELLGLEDDLESAINKAAETFDIVDVVWPADPESTESDNDVPAEDDFDIDSIEDDEDELNDTESEISDSEDNPPPVKESKKMNLDIEEGWYVYNQKDVPIAGPMKDENKAKKKAEDLGGDKLGFTVGYTSDFDSRKRKAKLNEEDDVDGVRDGMNIPMDSQYSLLAMRLKRPVEKKIVAFFSMTGIPGRYVINVDGVDDAIRSSADMLRKNMSVRRAFDEFYMLLAQAKGFSAIEKVSESDGTSAKRGTYLQKKFETILIALGMPEQLVSSSGPSVTSPMLFRVAKLIDSNQGLESALNNLALRLGLHSADIDMQVGESKLNEEVDVGNDEFLQKVIQLVMALGVPEDNLNYRKSVLIRAMREKKLSLRSRGMIEQRMDILLSMINANTQKREQ
jgi:hypothetical protein